MLLRTMTELTRTLGRLPAPLAERVGVGDAKPMELVSRFVANTATFGLARTPRARSFQTGEPKACSPSGASHRDAPGFAKLPFGAASM